MITNRSVAASLSILATMAMVCSGCGRREEAAPAAAVDGTMVVTSPAFAAGQPIPAKYTADGEDVSPPLQWTGIPEGARSIALICDDPDAPGGTWVHWLLYNLPPGESGMPEATPAANELPNGARHGVNDFGRAGYDGPAPPSGKAHRYRFRVYALDAVLILKPRAGRSELDRAMKGHILATGELTGTYQR